MNLGQTIRLCRKRRGMTQRDLSALCGISANSLSRIERGYTYPIPPHLHAICAAMHISVGGLLVQALEESDLPPSKRIIWPQFIKTLQKMLWDETY